MKRIARIFSWVVLVVNCFYTLVGGAALFRPVFLFPLATLALTIFVFSRAVPRWVSWLAATLNVVWGAGALEQIVFEKPPLWWVLIYGIGLILVPAAFNISALTERSTLSTSGANERLERP